MLTLWIPCWNSDRLKRGLGEVTSENCIEEETQVEKFSSVDSPLMENGELTEYRTFYLCSALLSFSSLVSPLYFFF